VDLLISEEDCSRDIPYLQALGINTLVVYAMNAFRNHTACMNLLADAGIYVLFILNNGLPTRYLEEGKIVFPTDYTAVEHLESLIYILHKYSSTLGFLVGFSEASTPSAPRFKSWVRDLKKYIREKGYRAIPVGVFPIQEVIHYLFSMNVANGIDFKPLYSGFGRVFLVRAG
jgi:1,3-beta-glucanosyltransferase GAS1